MNKRGINMIFIGALLVLLITIGSVFLFSWSHDLTEEMAESSAQSISDVECMTKVYLKIRYACTYEDKLNITIENSGQGSITKLITDITGQKNTQRNIHESYIAEGASKQISLQIQEQTGEPTIIKLTPEVRLNGKTGLCNTGAVKTYEIKNC